MINLECLNAPSTSDSIDSSSTYVISIDESGSTSYTKAILKLIKENQLEQIDNNRRYFTLCAVIFNSSDYQNARNLINKLKKNHWANGSYMHKDGVIKKVCFHTSDINQKRGPFSPETIDYNSFVLDLTNALDSLKCTIIAINIDLLQCVMDGYINNVYELAFKKILERYIYFAPDNAKASIFFESRGKREDNQLIAAIKRIILADGLSNISCDELQRKINEVHFNQKWKDDSYTYIGLEIADLFAYPIYRYAKTGNKGKDFLVLEKKIYGYPNKIKFGLLNYPKK